MSLILEALRKSEAERRRGQAPGLFVEQAPAKRKRQARTPAWAWGLGVLLVLVVAAWGWREFGRGLADGEAAPDSTADELPPSAATVPQAAPTLAPPPDTAASTLPAESIETPRDRPATSPPAVATSAEPVQAATAADRESAPATAAPAPPQIVLPATTDDTAPSPAATASAGSPPADVVPLADPAASSAAASAAAEEYVPRLAELPASDRAQLPPLKLSMHVYADDPAQRFVILDGKRLQEGASPAAGVVLERIRRDGLVLSVNGRRVLLARP